MIIIGVDPGLATTGYGIIKKLKKKKIKGGDFKCLNYGLIQTKPSFSSAERLKTINKELNKLINKYRPEVLAVENVYFFRNLKTAFPVSQAKGVILLSAANKNVPVYEFTPLQIKMAIVGYGRAEKRQVQEMIKKMLNLKELPKPDDAADALAVALCCGNLIKRGN
jgi:crossover junction endodeoxyribonuclease RuvC